MDAIVYDKVGKEAEKVRNALYGIYPQETITDATIASFDDGADGIPVQKLVANIEPVQAGSGDPSPDNVRPISGWTGAEISGTGINVWDEQWEVGDIKYADGNDLQSSTHFRNKGYIPIVSNIQYYLKSPGVNLYFYDKDKNYLGKYTGGLITGVANRVFTAPNSAHFMRLASSTDGDNIYNHDISINYPETDTEYHPYTGNQISVTFPDEAGTVYGGTLTVNPDRTGTLVVDMAGIDLSTVTGWSVSQTNPSQHNHAISGIATSTDNVKSELYANMPEYRASASSMPDGGMVVNNATLYVTSGAGVNPSGFLVYKLASPQTIPLTAAEVSGILTTLYGTNNIWADTGNIKKLTYRADLGKYIDSHITTAVADALNA